MENAPACSPFRGKLVTKDTGGNQDESEQGGILFGNMVNRCDGVDDLKKRLESLSGRKKRKKKRTPKKSGKEASFFLFKSTFDWRKILEFLRGTREYFSFAVKDYVISNLTDCGCFIVGGESNRKDAKSYDADEEAIDVEMVVSL